ncbi:MalM family protein [Vibrio astriarenae]|uniref:MalM family protein n=1 Tax=Vibrio astriarenae TaxID=1481923 RepID=UPI003735B8A1
MRLKALVIATVLGLAGCQSTEVIEQPSLVGSAAVSELSNLQAQPLRLPSSSTINISSSSQALDMLGVTGNVAVFELPANRGEYALNITSKIGKTAFVPHALIIDDEGEVVEQYDADLFEYRKPRLHLGNRLTLETDFFPPTNKDSVYLIVYTTQQDTLGHTDVIHPARLDAEARGNHLPEVADIEIPNSPYGEIEVSIERASFFSIGSSAEPKSNATPEMAVIDVDVQPETSKFYISAIEAAVKSDDIPKALALLDEAKALNVEGAQEAFVKAVNSK